jgi:hypothetical protein
LVDGAVDGAVDTISIVKNISSLHPVFPWNKNRPTSLIF